MPSVRSVSLIVVIVITVLLAGLMVALWPHLEGADPQIRLSRSITYVGRATPLVFSLQDKDTGLAYVKVSLIQGAKELTLLEKPYPSGSFWDRQGQVGDEISLEIKALELNLAQGPATLIIQARDRSLRSFGNGNLTRLELPVTVATMPPKLTVLSRIIHLNRGGVGLALYRASETTSVHGVQVGRRNFYGHSPWPQDREARLCYFAYPEDEEQNAPIKVFAQDAAGNQSTAGLSVRPKWKQFKHDQLNVGDEFLNTMMSRFGAEAPTASQAQALDVFLWVNDALRQQNHDKIQAVCMQTNSQQLWRGVFLRPQGKPMAGFADRRTYLYKGRDVSKSTHLGVDLADLAASPIKCAAAGQVTFADYLGIYGNCVIVDHGQGITTLYAHMTDFAVQVGQAVAADQTLGRSGATGLALGDHLHFSLLVGGVFVNPTEWWDPHWIKDNVELRFQEGNLPWPTQDQQKPVQPPANPGDKRG